MPAGGLKTFRKYEVKGCVWKAVTPWVSYALRKGQCFKTLLISSIGKGIERSFRCEHHLIMICVEIAPNYNPFNGRHCSSDHVPDVRQQLSNSDFSFSNVLCGLGLTIPVSD